MVALPRGPRRPPASVPRHGETLPRGGPLGRLAQGAACPLWIGLRRIFQLLGERALLAPRTLEPHIKALVGRELSDPIGMRPQVSQEKIRQPNSAAASLQARALKKLSGVGRCPMDAGATRKTDREIALLRAAEIAALRRGRRGEHRDTSKLAARRLEPIAGSRPGRHRAEPLVAQDDSLGLGERDFSHCAAFECVHLGPGIACGLGIADAALMGDGGDHRSSAGAIGALSASASAIAAGGPSRVDMLAAGSAGGRDFGSGVSAHGRSRLRGAQSGGCLGRC